MENKKLLKFLLKDLSELEELVAEKSNNGFDELEWEFLNTRISGAKKLVNILYEKENVKKSVGVNTGVDEVKKPEEVEVKEEGNNDFHDETEKREEEKVSPAEEIETPKKKHVETAEPEMIKEEPVELAEVVEKDLEVEDNKRQEEEKVELEDQTTTDDPNKRLGDSFLKEKSVNDLMSSDSNKLEHKLSNRPVSTIQSAIGINDRFQYIRELFDGDADLFGKSVAELDKMEDIKEAVSYLQQNFKWKKNETSLKFVNLVKRRFSNE